VGRVRRVSRAVDLRPDHDARLTAVPRLVQLLTPRPLPRARAVSPPSPRASRPREQREPDSARRFNPFVADAPPSSNRAGPRRAARRSLPSNSNVGARAPEGEGT
jgi:hypothetical protein